MFGFLLNQPQRTIAMKEVNRFLVNIFAIGVHTNNWRLHR